MPETRRRGVRTVWGVSSGSGRSTVGRPTLRGRSKRALSTLFRLTGRCGRSLRRIVTRAAQMSAGGSGGRVRSRHSPGMIAREHSPGRYRPGRAGALTMRLHAPLGGWLPLFGTKDGGRRCRRASPRHRHVVAVPTGVEGTLRAAQVPRSRDPRWACRLGALREAAKKPLALRLPMPRPRV